MWRHRVRPLDVQRNFFGPIRVRRRKRAAAGLADNIKARRSAQIELLIEYAKIRGNVGVVVGVHDRDRLACAGPLYLAVAEVDLVEPVGMGNLCWRETLY